MNYRFYITRSTTTVEVFPLNFNSTSLIDEVEAGRIFRRRKFNGALMFGTNSWAENEDGDKVNRKDDFDYFWDVEITGPCEALYLEITRDGANYWNGFFTTSKGKFNLDKCTFEVIPIVLDKYTGFDDNGDTQYNILAQGSLYEVRMSRIITDYVYTRNRLLLDVIGYLARQVDPLVTVVSSFFNDVTNPVTLAENRYNHITITQKSDIKRWNSSDASWKGFMSFNEAMELLKIFNVYWTYDDSTNELLLEHISYFTYADGIDLRTQKLHTHVNEYSYSGGDMPKYENFSFMEAEHEDFIPHSISYTSPCVNQDAVQSSWNVTTDIEYIQDCMNSTDKKGNISDDGWVLLANYEDGGDLYVYMNQLHSYTDIKFNADLSWGILHRNFFKHDRVLIDGLMNGSGTTFYSARKNIIQEASAIICDPFDASELVTTELGEVYFGGKKAEVRRAELFPSGLIKMVLAYGPEDNPVVPVEYANLIQIIEVANDVYPAVPTATHYYAQTSRPVDAELTITFYITILTDYANHVDTANQTITIPIGTTEGDVNVLWPIPELPELNQCRWSITLVSIVGGALTWAHSFNLDKDADCV